MAGAGQEKPPEADEPPADVAPSSSAPVRGNDADPGAGPPPVGDAGSDRVVARDAIGVPAPPLPAVDCKAARFCDDFESYPAGAKPGGGWGISTGGGATLVVDTTRSYSGARAVAIKAPGGASSAQAYMSRGPGLLPLPSNVLFGRMMVFLAASPGHDVHWDNVFASGTLPGGGRGTYSFGGFWELFWPSYQPHHCWKIGKTRYAVGKWFCLQWQFDGSGAAVAARKNQMRFWIDGVAHGDFDVDRFGSGCTSGNYEWIAPTFDKISLGWVHYQAPPIPIEMWIDDVAIDEKPISCPAPRP